MLGQTKQILYQIGQSPIDFMGARSLFTLRQAIPEALAPQDLVAAPQPGERANSLHNTGNMPLYLNVNQLPPNIRTTQSKRLSSHYTFLPVGKQFQATFGSN